jgi:hypothetical protein
MRNLQYSRHAADVIMDREINKLGIERVIANPEQIHQDPKDPALQHFLATIPENANRVPMIEE